MIANRNGVLEAAPFESFCQKVTNPSGMMHLRQQNFHGVSKSRENNGAADDSNLAVLRGIGCMGDLTPRV